MATRSGGARARGLGSEIRKIRESLDRSLEAVAAPAGLSISTLSRIENGQRICKADELISILTVLGVTGKERERLLRLTRDSARFSWLGLGEDLAQQFVALTSYEDDAIRMHTVQPLHLPGLLQTATYARTLLLSGDNSDVEAAVQGRLLRQSNLSRPSLETYVAVVDESVLCRAIGGPEVMAHQLNHLLNVSSLGQVTIRVVPFDNGWYRGLDGAFTVFDLPRGDQVIYFEAQASGIFFEGPDTDSFRTALRHSLTASVDPEESTAILQKYRDKWESG